jgi:tetratricopeptide (TPR) repeat protein
MAGIILGVALTVGAPAVGQTTMELGGQTLAVGRLEMARLSDLGQTLSASRAFQDRALAAARAVVNSPDARYVFALYQLEIGRRRRDDALRLEALNALIPNRATRPERLPDYLGQRGDIAFRARDYATAASDWGRLAELRPNDPQALMNLAQVRAAQNDAPGALDLIRRGIATRGDVPAPETWHRQRLSIAYNGRLLDESAAAAQALLAAYPTAENWRLALVAYRQLAAPRDAAEIDMLRLMRAAGVLAQPAEYQRLAQLLLHAGLLAEARAVLDEGLSRHVLDRSVSPTPEIVAELERHVARPRPPTRPIGAATGAALQVRRGAALVLAGDREAAAAAFRASTENATADAFYAELARFWLAWLGNRRFAAATG